MLIVLLSSTAPASTGYTDYGLPDECKPFEDKFEKIRENLQNGYWIDAEMEVYQVRAKAPDCRLVPFYLGKIHYYRHQDRKALYYFNRLAEQYPDMQKVYHYRGLIFYQKGLVMVALEEFHKVMDLHRTIGSGYFIRYILPLLEKDGELDPSHIDTLLDAVTLDTARELTRGFLAYFQDDYESALVHFRAAVNHNRRHAAAWMYAGRCHEMLRQPVRARNAYNQAIAIDDSYASAWLYRGLIKLDQGNWYGGCRDLRTASSLENHAADLAIRNYCNRRPFSCRSPAPGAVHINH